MAKSGRFEVRKENGSLFDNIKIIVDKETGVQYLFYAFGEAGGLSVLMDKDGRPLIDKGDGIYGNNGGY